MRRFPVESNGIGWDSDEGGNDRGAVSANNRQRVSTRCKIIKIPTKTTTHSGTIQRKVQLTLR